MSEALLETACNFPISGVCWVPQVSVVVWIHHNIVVSVINGSQNDDVNRAYSPGRMGLKSVNILSDFPSHAPFGSSCQVYYSTCKLNMHS